MLVFNHRFVLKKTLLGKQYVGDTETGRVIVLNETAAYILHLLETDSMELSKLVSQLSIDFNVSEEQIRTDIQELLLQMTKQGILDER